MTEGVIMRLRRWLVRQFGCTIYDFYQNGEVAVEIFPLFLYTKKFDTREEALLFIQSWKE